MTEFQTDLFGQIIEPTNQGSNSLRNKNKPQKLKWSFSKRTLLESCLRKYFYRYYAGKHEGANVEKFLSIKFLKELSNHHLVAGKIIHNLIRLYFTQAKLGKQLTEDWMKTLAQNKIRDSINYTHDILVGKDVIHKYPPFVLQEIFYDDQSYRQIYQEAENKVIVALGNFMKSPTFDHFRSKGKLPGSFVEKKFFIPINEQITISGEADLAYYQDGNFEINDWKTGKVEDGDDSMQLLTYTLWAIEQIGVDQNKITIFKSYLNEDKKKMLSLSEREIFRNKLAIRQSADAMLEIAGFGEAGEEQAFTPCRQQKICSMCPYQKICK